MTVPTNLEDAKWRTSLVDISDTVKADVWEVTSSTLDIKHRRVIGSGFSSHPQSRSGWLYDVDTTDAGCPSLAEGRPGAAGLSGARDGYKFAA